MLAFNVEKTIAEKVKLTRYFSGVLGCTSGLSHQENLSLVPRYVVTNSEEVKVTKPHRWCFHLVVVVGFVCTNDPESYAGGSVATGRASQAGQVIG
jgi:hypothetical protein